MAARALPAVTLKSVLIVENDLEACVIFEQILRDDGFDVCAAATAEAALLQLETALPSAILIDLHLPTLDGLECLRRIRATPRLTRIPVTVITADYLIDDNVVAQIEALGGNLCFKPIWEEDLLRIARGATAR